MAEPIHYPDITDAILTPFRVLRVLYNAHPGLLDSADCPYSEEQKVLLREFLGETGGGAERSTFLDEGEDRNEVLERQIALTLEDMRAIEKRMTGMDQKDKIAFLKAKPGLLERLIDLNDRSRGQRVVGDFMKRMYEFIDKRLDADQRTALVKELGAFVGEEQK